MNEKSKIKKSVLDHLFSKSYFENLKFIIMLCMINLVQFLIIIILIISLVKVTSRYTNTPFIVEVNPETKEVINTKVIDDTYRDSIVWEKQIENKLSEIITLTRSIPTDKEFYQRNLDRVQAYFTREAGEQLRESLSANQVTEKLNNRDSVTVDIDSVIKLERNKRKYQVMWTENLIKVTGEINVKKYIAIIDVITVEVKSSKMLKENPFGIMIKDINISESNIKN